MHVPQVCQAPLAIKPRLQVEMALTQLNFRYKVWQCFVSGLQFCWGPSWCCLLWCGSQGSMQTGAHTCTVHFLFYVYNFTYVSRAGPSLVCGLSSGCGEQGLLFSVACGLLAVASLAVEHRLGHVGFRSRSCQAPEHRPAWSLWLTGLNTRHVINNKNQNEEYKWLNFKNNLPTSHF